jgi:hypothetical protein
VQRHLQSLRKESDKKRKEEEMAKRIIGISNVPVQEKTDSFYTPVIRAVAKETKEKQVTVSSSVQEYVQEEHPDETVHEFKFKEKEARLSDNEQTEVVKIKKRKIRK